MGRVGYLVYLCDLGFGASSLSAAGVHSDLYCWSVLLCEYFFLSLSFFYVICLVVLWFWFGTTTFSAQPGEGKNSLLSVERGMD